MTKKLKVFGGTIFYGTPRKQIRVIVATYTKKQAVELLNTVTNISYTHFNDYFSKTGNVVELSVATEVGVWVTPDDIREVEKYTKIS